MVRTTHGHHRCGSERSLPLSYDVVGLISHRCRHIRVASSRNQVGAKVTNVGSVCKPKDCDTNDFEDTIEDDDVAAYFIPVAHPRLCEAEEEAEAVALGFDQHWGQVEWEGCLQVP